MRASGQVFGIHLAQEHVEYNILADFTIQHTGDFGEVSDLLTSASTGLILGQYLVKYEVLGNSIDKGLDLGETVTVSGSLQGKD